MLRSWPAMNGHGLVMGKFYPPHNGHHDVIRRAADECERVTVVVVAASVESIPLADRVGWLREEHSSESNVAVVGAKCDSPVDVTSDVVWRAQTATVRAALRLATAAPVDVVYSAEDYGDELAARLDAKHLRVGRAPRAPSSTAVRRDLVSAWSTLAPATRAGLATRAIVVGGESTGTTTVSRAVADRFRARGGVWDRTECVPEFGREFTEVKWDRQRLAARSTGRSEPALADIEWTVSDFDEVALDQTRRENRAARSGSPVLVCDTDAFATSVWERRYLGTASRPLQPWATDLARRDVYLLTDHTDVPWQDDGLREGDLAIRAAMTNWFEDALTNAGHSWVLLTGSLDERVDLAGVSCLRDWSACFP